LQSVDQIDVAIEDWPGTGGISAGREGSHYGSVRSGCGGGESSN
jgi:hypothetical protein